jgi:hypothetical protein
MDVAGLKDHEIQASLLDAWDTGHDAVMLKNYTTPAGFRSPEVFHSGRLSHQSVE